MLRHLYSMLSSREVLIITLINLLTVNISKHLLPHVRECARYLRTNCAQNKDTPTFAYFNVNVLHLYNLRRTRNANDYVKTATHWC